MCVHEILMTTTVFGDRKKSEHTSKKSDPVKKATSRKKSDIHLKNDQKSEKKQNDEFSHEKSKTGRFIYGPLFLPGALGGAFYPIYGKVDKVQRCGTFGHLFSYFDLKGPKNVQK